MPTSPSVPVVVASPSGTWIAVPIIVVVVTGCTIGSGCGCSTAVFGTATTAVVTGGAGTVVGAGAGAAVVDVDHAKRGGASVDPTHSNDATIGSVGVGGVASAWFACAKP